MKNVSLNANQNLTRKSAEDRKGILDLRANIGEKTAVNIEIQLTNKAYMPDRLLYYWARIYGESLQKSEEYEKLKKTISIMLLDYEMKELTTFKDSHTEWHLLEKRNVEIEVFKNIEMHIIEMPKILRLNKRAEDGLKNWVEFILNPESENVKMKVKEDEKLNEAYEKLETISGDAYLKRMAELEYKWTLDRNSEMAFSRKVQKEASELKKGKESFKAAKESFKKEQVRFKKEQANLKKEQFSFKKEQENLKEEQASLKEEQASLKEEQASLKEEQASLKKAKAKLQKERLELAKNLLREGIDINKIVDITELTIKEVKDIQKTLDKLI